MASAFDVKRQLPQQASPGFRVSFGGLSLELLLVPGFQMITPSATWTKGNQEAMVASPTLDGPPCWVLKCEVVDIPSV